MRDVEITNIIESQAKDHPGTEIRHEKEICKFHMFTGGYISGTVAIVEHDDGRVSEIPVHLCRFINKGAKLCKI